MTRSRLSVPGQACRVVKGVINVPSNVNWVLSTIVMIIMPFAEGSISVTSPDPLRKYFSHFFFIFTKGAPNALRSFARRYFAVRWKVPISAHSTVDQPFKSDHPAISGVLVENLS